MQCPGEDEHRDHVLTRCGADRALNPRPDIARARESVNCHKSEVMVLPEARSLTDGVRRDLVTRDSKRKRGD